MSVDAGEWKRQQRRMKRAQAAQCLARLVVIGQREVLGRVTAVTQTAIIISGRTFVRREVVALYFSPAFDD